MASNPEPQQDIRISGALPLELILMITKSLSFPKVFSLSGIIKEHTLLAKLNLDHPLQPPGLAKLCMHPNVCGQLRRLHVVCHSPMDIVLLDMICGRCPPSMSLTVNLQGDGCLEQLKEHSQTLGRLRKLMVYTYELFPDSEDILSLETVCQLCPKLELDLSVGEFVDEKLIYHPEIIERLTDLSVDYAMVENLPSLQDVVCRSHSVQLKLNVDDPFPELCDYPALLLKLTELRIIYSTNENGIGHLNDICKRSPNLTNVELVMDAGLENLQNCGLIHARLDSLTIYSPEEREIPSCNEICRRCPKLQQWSCSVPLDSLKGVLQKCPAVAHIECFIPGAVSVTVSKSKCYMKIVCAVRFLSDLLQQVNDLQALRKLSLLFSEPFDKTSATFRLLRDISKNSPNLQCTKLEWVSRVGRRPPGLQKLVDDAMNDWKQSAQPRILTIDLG